MLAGATEEIPQLNRALEVRAAPVRQITPYSFVNVGPAILIDRRWRTYVRQIYV
jgi:hypothetical protein